MRASWRRDGFVLIPGLLEAAQVEALRDECERLRAHPRLFRIGTPGVPDRLDVDGLPAPDRLDPVAPHSPLCARLALDPRLLGCVEAFLGDRPLLFKDKLHLKPPRTRGYGLHQDHATTAFLGVPPDDLPALLLAIDDCTQENGTVEFLPGLHGARLPAPPGEPLDVDPRSVDLAHLRPVELRAGDGLLIHALAPHRSGPNLSRGPRRIVLFTYSAARHGDLRERYYRERAAAMAAARSA